MAISAQPSLVSACDTDYHPTMPDAAPIAAATHNHTATPHSIPPSWQPTDRSLRLAARLLTVPGWAECPIIPGYYLHTTGAVISIQPSRHPRELRPLLAPHRYVRPPLAIVGGQPTRDAYISPREMFEAAHPGSPYPWVWPRRFALRATRLAEESRRLREAGVVAEQALDVLAEVAG